MPHLDDSTIYLLHWDSVPDGEVGFFLDIDGNIHEYAYVPAEQSIYHHHVDSWLQDLAADFVQGYYAASPEPSTDRPLSFLAGEIGARLDALTCEAGNVPCGKRCLPKGQVCRSKGGLAKGAAIAGIGLAGTAALGAGALLAKTEKGREAVKEAGEMARQRNVVGAGQRIGRGVKEGAEEVVTKGAEKAGRYVGEQAVKAVTKERGKTAPSTKNTEPGLAGKAIQSFAKGAKEAAVEEGKAVAKKKAESIKSKIKAIANKEIAYLPGERKLREKIKASMKKK
jgi:hypothetical protein